MDITEVSRIITHYYKQLCTNKMDSLEEIHAKAQPSKAEP